MGYKQTASGDPIYARPERALGQESFKRTDDGTEQMNVDGTPAGTAVVVWNGDGTFWTASGTGSSTTGAAHSGTYGWDTGVAAKDATTVFDNGSMIDVAGTYQQLEIWMNPRAFPGGSFLSLQWLDNADGAVGSRLDVNDYVTNFDLDVWQKVTIPIADFSLSGNVQKLRFQYRKVAGQHFYFDDIELVESAGGGGPYIFRVAAPDADTIYHMSLLVMMLSESEVGWDHNKFSNITALTNGLLLRQRRLSTAEVLWSFNSKDNVDLFGRYHPQESFTFNDGKLLVGFMVKPGAAAIVVTDDDVLEFVVRDDLSSIDNIRAFAHYGVEEVIDG